MPHLHTITPVQWDHRYDAFKYAAAGGGSPPQWTYVDDLNDASHWTSPADAAGGLVLWDQEGEFDRCEPPTVDPSRGGETAFVAVLRSFAGPYVGTSERNMGPFRAYADGTYEDVSDDGVLWLLQGSAEPVL